MFLRLPPAERQRVISKMRSAPVLSPPMGGPSGGGGYRTAVLEVVYLPGHGIAWAEVGSGPHRLPQQLFEWAKLVTEELADIWELDPADLYPFPVRFWSNGDELLVDMDRPE